MPCDVGDYQCSDVWLQTCKADRTGWDNKTKCDTPALCKKAEKRCDPPTCQPGDHNCSGADLLVCNDSLNGFVKTTCASAALCDELHTQCDI